MPSEPPADTVNHSLEVFDSLSHSDRTVVTFTTDEVTALCPFDFGGPDFYEVEIRYAPLDDVVESRSLKEFLQSYRSREITAEGLAEEIYQAVEDAAKPLDLYVRVEQARRGGIEETVEVGDRELR